MIEILEQWNEIYENLGWTDGDESTTDKAREKIRERLYGQDW